METIRFLRATIPTTIKIELNLEQNCGFILADPTQIHQVLINLCTNAAHAMREKGGVLEVSVVAIELEEDTVAQYPDLAPGSYLTLSVSDTGHGIDDKIIDRIFEPYFTTKSIGDGTGLGLSVVHGIVRNHGGVITVSSSPGKGSYFEVYLPAVSKTAAPEKENTLLLPTGKEHILFIDDEKDVVDLGKDLLEKLGYNVSAKTCPIKALDSFRDHPEKYDLIITDMTMPKLTGEKLAMECLKIRPEIPIMHCTGFSSSITPQMAYEIGIKDFLIQPISLKDMAISVRKVMPDSH